MTSPIIVAEHVTKRYDKKNALDNFSCIIPSGRIVGIHGPNGCGKSSLFRAITGLIRPEEGKLEVLSQPAGWKTNRGIAYLPDRARWYPNHTAQLAFEWGQSFLPGFDMEIARRLASFMDIELNMKMAGMSRGQEALVMLVLCLARHVPLIILDEPFAGVDVISREFIIAGIIECLEDREQSVLISTHDILEAEGLFEYTVMMSQGKAIWSGETDELRAQYGSLHDVFQKLYKKEWGK